MGLFDMSNKFKPFTLVYYLALLVGALWAMNKWIMLPLMLWGQQGKVYIGHLMTMWMFGLAIVCAAAYFLTKEINRKE